MKKILLLLTVTVISFQMYANANFTGWRWRNDDGNIDNATNLTATDVTPVTISDPNKIIRLRVRIDNPNSITDSNLSLYYRNTPLDSVVTTSEILEANSTFTPVGPDAFFDWATSVYVPDGTSTNSYGLRFNDLSGNQMTTYSNGKFFSSNLNALSIPQGTYSEIEYCIKPTSKIVRGTYFFMIGGNIRLDYGTQHKATLAELEYVGGDDPVKTQKTISSYPIKTAVGDTFFVAVNTTDLLSSDSILSYKFNFHYDSSKISYFDYNTNESISQNGTLQIKDSTAGELKVDFIASRNLSGTGKLLNLRFLALCPGLTTPVISDFFYSKDTVKTIVNGEISISDISQVGDSTNSLEVYLPNYGQLSSIIKAGQRSGVKNLRIRGFMNASDFTFMNDSLIHLTTLDLSELKVQNNILPGWSLNGERLQSLQKVTLPKDVTTIADYSFYHCFNLTDVMWPDSLKTIGSNAFLRCSSLESINLPQSLEKIGISSFTECTSLKTIAFSKRLRVLDNYAFYNCSSLSGRLIYPDSLKTIGAYTFNNCPLLTECTMMASTPPLLDGSGLNSVLKVYVPKGFASAYRNAANWNQKMIINGDDYTSITVHLTVAGTLGEQVLKQIDYANNVNKMIVSGPLNESDMSFIKNMMSSLISIDMSGSILEILPAQQFYNNKFIKEVILPNTLKTIGNSAFGYCTNLMDFALPTNLVKISGSAFTQCINIFNITFPASLKTIESNAFQNCNGLDSIRIPEGITTIEPFAFYNCENLSHVFLPESVLMINIYAFAECYKLTTVGLPAKLTTLDYYCFGNCKNLKSILLPSTLTTINFAFANCNSLSKVTCLQPTPPVLSNDVFEGINKYACELSVPLWSKNMYKLASYWGQFQNVTTYDSEIADMPINGTLVLEENLRPKGLPNVTIQPNGSLSVKGDDLFNMNNFRMENTILEYPWGSNSVFSNLMSETNSMFAKNVDFRLNVMGNYWAYLCMPFDVAVSTIKSNDETQFIFRKFDGAVRAANGSGSSWVNMTSDSILHRDHGYIFQCSKDLNDLILKATDSTRNQIFSNDKRVVLSEYPAMNASDRSWNFIGNPYPSYFDIHYMDYTAPITVWRGNRYEALSVTDDNYILRPMEAFFVQKPSDLNSIHFLPEGRQRSSVSLLRNASTTTDCTRILVNLLLSDDAFSDKSRLVINPVAKTEYEMDCDASKFMSTDSKVPQLYSIDEKGNHYAINERPIGSGNIRLGYYAGKSGNHILSLNGIPENLTVRLKDNLLKTEVTLNNLDYAFSTEQGTFNERFYLYMEPGEVTLNSEMSILHPKVNVQNGKLLVEAPAGCKLCIFNLNGTVIYEIKMDGSSIEIPVNKGIYIVKINNLVFKTVVL